MAKITFSCVATTWVYPELTYNPLSGVDSDVTTRTKYHWYRNHSNRDKWAYCYQGGVSDYNGKYNGNMMSTMQFKGSINGKTKGLKGFISEIGGADKITSIKLQMDNQGTYNSSATVNFYMTDDIDYLNSTGSSVSELGLTSIGSKSIAKGGILELDITSHKAKLTSKDYIVMYKANAYDSKSYYAYFDKNVKLVIEYNPNSAPVANVSLSASNSGGYYVPNITLNGSATDQDNNLHATPYYYEVLNSSGTSISNSGWTSQVKHSFNLSNYRGGTITAKLTVRDTENEKDTSTKSFKVNSLPKFDSDAKITVSGATNNVFNGQITLTWPKATDPNGHAVKYKIEVDKNGTRSTLVSSHDGLSYSTGSGWTDGTKCKFYITPTDGLENGSAISSGDYYVNKPPSTPSISTTAGHYESLVPVSWSEVSGTNGSTISSYFLEVYKNNVLIETKEYTKTVTSVNYKINDASPSFERGCSIKFRVRAKDNLGEYSSWSSFSAIVTRNNVPSNPTGFKVNKDILYCKNTTPLIWNRSLDKDNDKVTYDIEYKSTSMNSYASVVKDLAASGSTTESYNHTISTIANGSTIAYRVRAKDSLGAVTDWVNIISPAIVNTPPTTPAINYPIDARMIYIRNPRIIFTTGKTVNGLSVTVYVKVGTVVYNSVTHQEYFDRSKYPNSTVGVFTCPQSLSLSNATISIYTSDGMDVSSTVSRTYMIENSTAKMAVANETIISSVDLNNIRSMINVNLSAYGLNTIDWKVPIISGTIVSSGHFEEMRIAAASLVTFINGKSNVTSNNREVYKTAILSDATIDSNLYNHILRMTIEP